MNSEGIPAPRGKKWGKTTVHNILTNEAYTGTLVWGRTSKNSQKAPPSRVEDAREKVEAWRLDYNSERPHGALENLAPLEYVPSVT